MNSFGNIHLFSNIMNTQKADESSNQPSTKGAFNWITTVAASTFRGPSSSASNSKVTDQKAITFGCVTLPDGVKYQGRLKDGEPDGFGCLIYNKVISIGEFKDGEMRIGRTIFPSGNIYEGEYTNDELTGFGRTIFPNGTVFEGEHEKGVLNGYGRIIYKENLRNTIFEGFFVRGIISGVNRFNISDLNFFKELYSIENGGGLVSYSLQILVDYLTHAFGRDPTLEPVLTLLKDAGERIFKGSKRQAKIIFEELKSGKECLLCFGFEEHTMFLNLIPSQDGERIICEIFNSGRGLELFHEKHPYKPKFQTMKKVIIPKKELTEEILLDWINHRKWKSVTKAYASLFTINGAIYTNKAYTSFATIPDATFFKPNSEYDTPFVWTSEQKGDNCSMKSALLVLRHKWPGYKAMHQQLLKDCLDSVLARYPEKREEILAEPRVQYKQAKSEKLEKVETGKRKRLAEPQEVKLKRRKAEDATHT